MATLLPSTRVSGPVFAQSGVRILIGGVPAVVLGVDASGALSFQIPSYTDVCTAPGSCTGPAGYKSITVSNPAVVVTLPNGTLVDASGATGGRRLLNATQASAGGQVRSPLGSLGLRA